MKSRKLIKRSAKVLILIFINFLGYSALAQSERIDSLQILLDKSPTKNRRTELLIELTRQHAKHDNAKALATAKVAYKSALETGDSLNIIKTGRIIAQLFARLDKSNELTDIIGQVLPIAKRHKVVLEEANMYNLLGLVNINLGRYDEALRFFIKSLTLRESNNAQDEIASSYHNIGFVYYKLNNPKKAIEYFNKCLKLNGNFGEQELTLITLGMCNIDLKEYHQAKLYIDQAFKYCENSQCAVAFRRSGELGYGEIYRRLGKLDSAKIHFTRSYNLAVIEDDKRFQCESLLELGGVARQANENKQAKKYLEGSEVIAIDQRYKRILMDIYSEFITLYRNIDDYKKKSFYQGKYIAYRDSVFNEEMTNNLAAIQVEFEEQQSKATIELNEEVIKNQKAENRFIIAFAILLLLLCLLLVKIIYDKKVVSKMLDAKVHERIQYFEENLTLWQQKQKHSDSFFNNLRRDLEGELSSMSNLCDVALTETDSSKVQESLEKIHAVTGSIKSKFIERSS